MEGDIRRADNLFTTIARKAECCICFEAKALVVTNCGHSICPACADKMLEISLAPTYKCPICAQKMRTRKDGWPNNYDLNDILESFRKIENPCKNHSCFSKELKCITCQAMNLCLQCIQEHHLGHLVVKMDDDEEVAIAGWKHACRAPTDIASSESPHSRSTDGEKSVSDGEHEKQPVLDVSTQSGGSEDKAQDRNRSLAAQGVSFQEVSAVVTPHDPVDALCQGQAWLGVMRGDGVLYLYHSAEDGERHLGLGLVRRVLYQEEFLNITAIDSSVSTKSNGEPCAKKTRTQLDPQRHQLRKTPAMLRVSRMAPQSSAANDKPRLELHEKILSGAPLRPMMASTIDIPIVSVISRCMRVDGNGE